MKILHTIGKRNIVIFNDKNYALCGIEKGEDGKEKTVEPVKYYGEIASAVKAMSKEVANDRAKNLKQWLELYRMTNDKVVNALVGYEPEKGAE